MQRTHLYFSSKIKNICMYVLKLSFHISVHIACPFASMYLGILSKHEHSVRHVQLIHTVHWKKEKKPSLKMPIIQLSIEMIFNALIKIIIIYVYIHTYISLTPYIHHCQLILRLSLKSVHQAQRSHPQFSWQWNLPHGLCTLLITNGAIFLELSLCPYYLDV